MKIFDFLKNPRNFLIYCGSPGIGKTYLCAALTEWAMTTFENYRYWNEYDLLEKVRSSMSDMKGDYHHHLRYLVDDPLLFLNDVGSSGWTEWREEVLFSIVDQRYNSMQPTIITSNFTKKEFLENYSPRIMSRLFAKENTIIEIADGVDRRQNENNEAIALATGTSDRR